MKIKEMITAIKKDFSLSFFSEKELRIVGYNRISAVLTAFHRFFTAPALIVFVIYNISTLFFSDSKESLFFKIFFSSLSLVILLPIGIRILTAKHVFLDENFQYILVFLPYRNKIITIEKDFLCYISGSKIIKPDFITLTYEEGSNRRRYHFLGPFQISSIYDEHPLVGEIYQKMRFKKR